LQSSLDLTIRVAAPAACTPALPIDFVCGTESASVQEAALARVQRLLARPGVLPTGVELTHDASAADLLLVVTGHRLYILRASAFAAASGHGAAVEIDAPDVDSRLQGALLRAARAVGLARLGTEFPDLGDELAVELRTRDRLGRWHMLSTATLPKVPFDAELAIRLQNVGPRDLDVTLLSIDDHFEISAIFPVDLESNRLRSGSAQLEVHGWARPSGRYQILVISEPALAGKPHDLSYLAQPGVTRGARGVNFGRVLERIGFERRKTRSADDAAASGSIRVLGYEVIESIVPPAASAR
jgi:hypothetical protein